MFLILRDLLIFVKIVRVRSWMPSILTVLTLNVAFTAGAYKSNSISISRWVEIDYISSNFSSRENVTRQE